jgi:hypothetical protein
VVGTLNWEKGSKRAETAYMVNKASYRLSLKISEMITIDSKGSNPPKEERL